MLSSHLLLYVEDSFDDRFLFVRACQLAAVSFRVNTVENGKEALDYFGGTGQYADRSQFPLPQAVLLDLKMPLLDGFGVLGWIRHNPAFADLPVLIFTSSYQHADIGRAYADGANAFLTKPSLFPDLVRLAAAIGQCFTSQGIDTAPLRAVPQFRHL